MQRLIAVLGEYTPSYEPHRATNAAIEHSNVVLGATDIAADWISTQAIDERRLRDYSGLWIAPGSPYKSLEKTLRAIRYAREHRAPCLGTCGGVQHLLLEYVRNVLGDPYASILFIPSSPVRWPVARWCWTSFLGLRWLASTVRHQRESTTTATLE